MFQTQTPQSICEKCSTEYRNYCSKMSSAGSQERKVICRACDFENEILLKNYERHLIRFHPDKNPKDPRGKGPKPVTISALFFNQKRKREADTESESGGAAASVSNKPRHSSGDSGVGVPETDQDTEPEIVLLDTALNINFTA